MELRQLTYFAKAAEMSHFTEAAASLYITQSTLSQQIKQLEQELGVQLFDRIGKHVQLTEAGRLFLQHTRQVLLEVEKGKQAMQDLQQALRGELRIGVTYAFTSLLLPALTRFPLKYPGIYLSIEYGTTNELENKLRASELDLVMAFHQKAKYNDLEVLELFQSQMVLAVSAGNPLAKEKSIGLQQLNGMDLIFPASGFSARDSLNEVLERNKIKPAVKLEVNDVHAILKLVEKGPWATILNERVLQGWKRLVGIPIEGRELQRRAYLIWQRDVYRKKAAVLFTEELLKEVKAENKK
ncbi:LysR family cyn operon transcriptional activator [Chitinophaga terrae (ex Kim and Jung 2007)]|uniref:LysR substrate-binding domain-containing protein n=1 Tax=Chitinophaga terrae (ex Kim and Jung 2007) TaxID=408074 RepID=UPI00277D20ED|nr:LysR substrate-binding domain-containing protein [Chitinophaga terrae (ex Kim and Jung 2007)]MDQ0109470.1 LysR family cyn operon transcriptional activator [Chitinophaga terrae (ex Kim and Jung 2007)]